MDDTPFRCSATTFLLLHRVCIGLTQGFFIVMIRVRTNLILPSLSIRMQHSVVLLMAAPVDANFQVDLAIWLLGSH